MSEENGHNEYERNGGGILRWILIVCCAAALGVSAWVGLKLGQNRLEELQNGSADADVDQELFAEAVPEQEVLDGYYYSKLTERQKNVYREILQGVREMEESIYLHAVKEDDPVTVYEYLLYDRPELFWCSGGSKITMYPAYSVIFPNYTCEVQEREERQKEIDAAVEESLSGISPDASDYEKVKYVYEYIVNTVDYDVDAPDHQNIYSSLVGRKSVCAGYSREMQYLLGKMGVECLYVTGEIKDRGSHGWNIVKCDGKYYQVDVTFADPVFLEAGSGEKIQSDTVNYDYLCCTDEEFADEHIPTDRIEYPRCVSDDLNYYRLNGMYYEEYDGEKILKAMKEGISKREASYTCKFAGRELYLKARNPVIEEIFPEAARGLADMYGLETVKYTYSDDEDHNKITVYWNYEN